MKRLLLALLAATTITAPLAACGEPAPPAHSQVYRGEDGVYVQSYDGTELIWYYILYTQFFTANSPLSLAPAWTPAPTPPAQDTLVATSEAVEVAPDGVPADPAAETLADASDVEVAFDADTTAAEAADASADTSMSDTDAGGSFDSSGSDGGSFDSSGSDGGSFDSSGSDGGFDGGGGDAGGF